MPLTFLGQLKPTMQQQIALQKALMALAKGGSAEGGPPLAQRLSGAAPTTYAGPTSALAVKEPSPLATKALAKPYFRPGAGSLEEALKAAKPSPEGVPTAQTAAWAKRTEMVEAEQAKLDAMADALYTKVQGLTPEDQDFILSKIATKGKPDKLAAALGAEPGTISPAAIRTDPLIKTMIDKHYIRLDETGKYSWMLPMKEKGVADVRTWIDESGWLNKETTFDDGTSETEIMGRPEKEAVETGLTSSEQLGWARLQFDVAKIGDIYVSQEMKAQGPAPIEGVTIVKRVGGKDMKATAEHVTAHWQAVKEGAEYRKVAAEGLKTKGDFRTKYQYDTEAIKNFQRNFGMLADGKWSDELGQALADNLLEGE